MNKRQKGLLKQVVDINFKIGVEEILDKKITSFGSGAHVTVPLKHRGKKAKIIIYH